MNEKNKRITGRPTKFKEPSRPVTLTLPERTLQKLQSIHPDKAQAIVKVVNAATSNKDSLTNTVQTIEVTPGQSLIVVGPSRALRKIPWLRLVEIAPSRYLLSIPSGTAIEALELAIVDLINETPKKDEYEYNLLEELKETMGSVRKGNRISKAEILFVANE